eukprot:6359782-Amphidinium_carterae.1
MSSVAGLPRDLHTVTLNRNTCSTRQERDAENTVSNGTTPLQSTLGIRLQLWQLRKGIWHVQSFVHIDVPL